MEPWLTSLPVEMDEVASRAGGDRLHARYELLADVEVTEPYRSVGVVLNVSAGGIRIAVDRALFTDADTVLKLFIPGGPIRTEHARVVWTRKLADGYVVGLRFVDPH